MMSSAIPMLLTTLAFTVGGCLEPETRPDEECGPNPCGACDSDCIQDDRCEDGEWVCECDCPDEECGPNPCDACDSDCTQADRCEDGEWLCECDCPDEECPDPEDPDVHYITGSFEDPEICHGEAGVWICEATEEIFFNECGCGCITLEGCPDPRDVRVHYIDGTYEDPTICEVMGAWLCEEDEVLFSNECGCGCMQDDPAVPRTPY